MISLEVSPTAVRFDQDDMWVDLSDGRKLGVPLAWFPTLFHSTPQQRMRVELSPCGLHWEKLDEDISVAGSWLAMVTRRGADRKQRRRKHAI